MIVQAMKSPLGMFMTDAKGLRFQAYMVVLMLPVNVGLSIVLAQSLGAVGPVIGSIVGVVVFQLLANWIYVARAERRVRGRTAGAASIGRDALAGGQPCGVNCPAP